MEGKSEYDTVQYIIGVLNRYYGDNPIISKFLSFLEENRDCREALLRHVLAAQAQIQDKVGSAEDVVLASLLPSSISGDLAPIEDYYQPPVF